jgi:DNA-binding beta-propeller fold protein YncE
VIAATFAGSAANAFAAETFYIPLGSADAVVIVNTERDAVVGRIEGLPAVHGLAGTPDGGYLIAGSYRERAAGGAPAKPASVSEEEHAAHHARPADSAPRSAPAVSTVSVIRTSDGSVVRRIDVPGAVHHVATSPDGRFAVVTHPNQDAISAIDLAAHEVVATVATGPLPNYAVFSPDGGRVYVSNAGNGTVSDVDASRWIAWSAQARSTWCCPPTAAVSSSTTSRTGPSRSSRSTRARSRRRYRSARRCMASISRMTARPSSSPSWATTSWPPWTSVSSADEPKVWVVDQETLAVLGEIAIGGKGHQMVQMPGT